MKTSYRAKQKNFKRSRKISRSRKPDSEESLQLIQPDNISQEINEEILYVSIPREIIDDEEEIFPDTEYDLL